MNGRRLGSCVTGAFASVALVACSDVGTSRSVPPAGASRETASTPAAADPTRPPRQRTESQTKTEDPPEPRRSHLSIPGIGLRSFPVVRYQGRPDDADGTLIQNRGPMASPRGPRGGVGPGDVGNFIVTGHRTSHTEPFAELPSLGAGDRVQVRSGKRVFLYRITRTRWTSFREPESRAAQEAAVPGRPEAQAVRPMITLSTCATPEDHAAGNYWSDRFGNPEHRIDKIGVLVGESPV